MHTHSLTLPHTLLLLVPWSSGPSSPPGTRCFLSPPEKGQKTNSRAMMSRPRPPRTVSPYRAHSHHSTMKGDHPPLFGFSTDAGNNNNGRGPKPDRSVHRASQKKRKKKNAVALHIIRPRNKPRKQRITVFSSWCHLPLTLAKQGAAASVNVCCPFVNNPSWGASIQACLVSRAKMTQRWTS